MDDALIERAVEAAARAMYYEDVLMHQPDQPPFEDTFDSEQNEYRDDVRPLVTAALAEVEADIRAGALRDASTEVVYGVDEDAWDDDPAEAVEAWLWERAKRIEKEGKA